MSSDEVQKPASKRELPRTWPYIFAVILTFVVLPVLIATMPSLKFHIDYVDVRRFDPETMPNAWGFVDSDAISEGWGPDVYPSSIGDGETVLLKVQTVRNRLVFGPYVRVHEWSEADIASAIDAPAIVVSNSPER